MHSSRSKHTAYPIIEKNLNLIMIIVLFRKLLDFMLDNLAISTSPPPSRPWLQLAPLDRTAPTALFTVMCYNVLCDRYATRCLSNVFSNCTILNMSSFHRFAARSNSTVHFYLLFSEGCTAIVHSGLSTGSIEKRAF
jgi:hypothetical protein